MWWPLPLENQAEGATHIKNVGLHGGPFILYAGISLCAFSLPNDSVPGLTGRAGARASGNQWRKL